MKQEKLKHWFNILKEEANQSKDPSTKVSAIAIGQFNQPLMSAYNGFPRGIADTPERLNDRPTKYKYVLHAEANLICNATLSGVSLYNSTILVYGLTICSECAKLLIQIKPKEVYSLGKIDPRWIDSYKFTIDLFKESGIMYSHYETLYEV